METTKNWKLVLGGAIVVWMYSVEVINGCAPNHHDYDITHHPTRSNESLGATPPPIPTENNTGNNLCMDYCLGFQEKRAF